MDESIISRAQLQEFRDLVKVLYPPNATSAKPTPEIYQPPSPVNPTFQATAPPSVVAPPSTSAQQVFVKYVT